MDSLDSSITTLDEQYENVQRVKLENSSLCKDVKVLSQEDSKRLLVCTGSLGLQGLQGLYRAEETHAKLS